jgi:hypothetical protein
MFIFMIHSCQLLKAERVGKYCNHRDEQVITFLKAGFKPNDSLLNTFGSSTLKQKQCIPFLALQPNVGLGSNTSQTNLSMRKGKFYTFLFDHAEGADIHLCSGVCTLVEERPSDTLGIKLFLPVATALVSLTSTKPLKVSLKGFQTSLWKIYGLTSKPSHVTSYNLLCVGILFPMKAYLNFKQYN